MISQCMHAFHICTLVFISLHFTMIMKMIIFQVFPSIRSIEGNGLIEFTDGCISKFQTIILATGYRSTVGKWLQVILTQNSKCFFNENTT